ncbi:hypothetical protein BCR42DRAFT_452736 [Absidia repens]|uniref:Uncharacterized protein n=1 Tax=Absidia repens TaxID=90262 RepID=A0A1X2ID08_9FUNG|nr:hypothetical protein BCR42DRAFT_452736 [Absidia repens]
MLTQDQTPPPKAVNIIRPSSPALNYWKQRPSPALNHHYQQQQQQQSHHSYYQHHQPTQPKVAEELPTHTTGTSHSTSTSSFSSSPSTLSTLSGGSGTNGGNNRLPQPTILNTSSFGFNFFQTQQNSTTSPSPTTWFKSPTTTTQPQQVAASTTAAPTAPTPPTTHTKALSTTGFMNSFTPRFFRVPHQSIEDTTMFLRRQASMSDIQDHHDNSSADQHHDHNIQADDDDDDGYDSIDGDTDHEEGITDIDISLDDDDDDSSEEEDSDSNSELDDTTTDYDDQDAVDDDVAGSYTDDELPIKVVARIKNGTIMNGKGEFVSKGGDDRASHSSWLDDARTSRKIADLEIEKTSLMALNATLESKVAQQDAKIAKLEKQLQLRSNEWPLSPVSDKGMDEEQPCFEKLISTELLTEDEIANDHVFQRLRCMLLGLIDQAEEAVRLKTKATGRVLTLYNGDDVEEDALVQENIITLDAPPAILKPSTKITPYSTQRQGSPTLRRQLQLSSATQHKRPLRRVSDAQDNRRQQQQNIQPQPSTATTMTARKRTPMQRSLSRASSPAVLVTTDVNDVLPPHVLRPTSPRPFSPPMQRSSTRPRPSHLRRSQDMESPKWHY